MTAVAYPLRPTVPDVPDPETMWRLTADLRSRFTFRFSTTGRSAAAVVADGHGSVFAEYWWLGDDAPRCRRVQGYRRRAAAAERDDHPYDVVPFDDGAVLVLSDRAVRLVGPTGTARELGTLPGRPQLVAPAPDGAHRVLFLFRDPTREAATAPVRTWLWPGSAELLHERAVLPPLLLRGGGWLDRAATRYVVNESLPGRHRPAVVDVCTGCVAPLDGGAGQLAWSTAPGGGRILLVTAAADGVHRLALRDRHGAVRAMPAADRLPGSASALSLHPDGHRLLLLSRRGLRDRLVLLDADEDTATALPDVGCRAIGDAVLGAGADGIDRIRAFAVGPGTPACILQVSAASSGVDLRWSEVLDSTASGSFTGWAPGHLASFSGGDGGEVEAVVCGHRDWRTAHRVLIALHGGPKGRWTLKFSPLFQLLAARGITVLALNPRGSTGYGEDFHRQVVGRWAGPDLHDVLAVACRVRSTRDGDPPRLYGESYGAYLALLAACAAPAMFGRVLAVAPMLSGARLHPTASPPVREMIDRLGGHHDVVDELGSRDLPARLGELSAEVMVVHGTADGVVPVEQSRRIVDALTRRGRLLGRDVHYVEVPDGTHAPLDGSADLHHAVSRFLAGDLPVEVGADSQRRSGITEQRGAKP